MAVDSPLISVRVVNVDWYLSDESKLPVVRIFGSTPAGQRACLHLHGALPYFMVRPMEDDNPGVTAQFQDPDSLAALVPELECAIESAMAVSAGRPGGAPPSASPHGEGEKTSTASASRPWIRQQQRVLTKLEVVRGVPFYGYHGEETLFIKVYVNNPSLTGKVASVLQAGHVMSTRFQPYESHVPFLLQVFIDYNISGMSYVHLRNALFLLPLPELSSIPASQLPDMNSGPGSGTTEAHPGVFVASTVPDSLIAYPLGERRVTVPDAYSTADGGEKAAQTSGSGQQAATRHADEVYAAQDLLAGISMSQLFSQPSSPAQTSRYREYAQPSPHKFPSPARPAAPETSAMGKKTPKKWWERQTTTEIEITGTVNDVINPSLLAAGKAEVGEKAVAVASLRELWDEERARSRAAGGGSQLSAPPGLELADSQDAWEPPEGLLTQDMRGAVNDLARSVVEKNPSAVSAASPWQSMSHICSSQARTSEQRGSRQEVSGSSHVELTPSRDGPLSQASIGSVATVSASPANYLIAPDAQDLDDDTDTHEGLLDMLAALRGSQGQSQRSPGGVSSRCSPTMTRHGTQLLHEQASQDPNPVSFEGHAEAITATQEKQEREEEELGFQMALAADSERHYDSDGSDDYQATQLPPSSVGKAAVERSIAGTDPHVAVSTPLATAADRTLRTDPLPPWSQRAASYPPWSQRSKSASRLRSAETFPPSSQRVQQGGSGGKLVTGSPLFLADMMVVDAEDDGTHHYGKEEGVEEEEEEEGDNGGDGDEDGELLSQLSARSLNALEDSVRASLKREGSTTTNKGEDSSQDLFGAQPPGLDSSELVGIIASQVELERSEKLQTLGDNDDNGRVNAMGAIAEEHEEEGGGATSDFEWTRGPVHLQYDDNIDHENSSAGQNVVAGTAAAADDERGKSDDDASETSDVDKSPLRLRGGVSIPRSRSTKSAQNAPQAAVSEPQVTASVPPAGGTNDQESSGDMAPAKSSNKRAPPPPPSHTGAALKPGAPVPKRQAPLLGAPGGLRRSTSITGGKFKPPRPAGTSKQISGAIVDESERRVMDVPGCDNPQQPPSPNSGPQKTCVSEASGVAQTGKEDSDMEESSDREERSQVVVPGWGSQGHHPVEYSEGQLSFVSTSQLRPSSLVRGRTGNTVADNSESRNVPARSTKRQKVLGEEGRSSSSSSVETPRPDSASILEDQHGGTIVGSRTKKTPQGDVGSRAKSTRSDTPSFDEDYGFDFGASQQDSRRVVTSVSGTSDDGGNGVGGGAGGSTAAAAAETDTDAHAADGERGEGFSDIPPTEEERRRDEARTREKGKARDEVKDVQNRWAGADARLRLAQARGTPSPSLRKRRNSGSVMTMGKNSATLPSSPVAHAKDMVSGSPSAGHRHPLSVPYTTSPEHAGDADAKPQGARTTRPQTVENDSISMGSQIAPAQTTCYMTMPTSSPARLEQPVSPVGAGTTPPPIFENFPPASSPTTNSGISSQRQKQQQEPRVKKALRMSPRMRMVSTAKIPTAEAVKATPTRGVAATAPTVPDKNSIGPRAQHHNGGEVKPVHGDGVRNSPTAPASDARIIASSSVRQHNTPVSQVENKGVRSGSSPDSLNGHAPPPAVDVHPRARVAMAKTSPTTPAGNDQEQQFSQDVASDESQKSDVNIAVTLPRNKILLPTTPATAGSAAASPSPSLPTPTPSSPVGDVDWNRFPALPLSGHSDHSDAIPLGQRTPALPVKRSPETSTPTVREVGKAGGGGVMPSVRQSSLGRRGLMSPESNVPGSPDEPERVLSGFTPPAPRRRVIPRRSGAVILVPKEKAPDPKACSDAFARLGVPQVLHTEPYYSRKEDVPERPREFGGKVFRIPHKDDLQPFDTLPSRQLLHAYNHQHAVGPTFLTPPAPAPARTTTTAPTRGSPHDHARGAHGQDPDQLEYQPPDEGRPTPPASYTPDSPQPKAYPWRSQNSGEGEGKESPLPSPGHSGQDTVAARAGSYRVDEREDCKDEARDYLGSGSVIVLSGDNERQQDGPVAVARGLDVLKREAALNQTGGRSRSHDPRRRAARVVELVPTISPPSRKAVAAWGRAHPSSTRPKKVVDDLDMPVLRSNRNALGVLAGGGGADLTDGRDDSAEMSMVADANTGQLVPVAVDRPPRPPLPPTTTVPATNTAAVAAAAVATAARSGRPTLAQTPPSPGGSCTTAPHTPASISLGPGEPSPRGRDATSVGGPVRPAKLPTQPPHRIGAKSQISPTTQTPLSCPSEEAVTFAFGLGARRAAGQAPVPAGAASSTTPTSAFKGPGAGGEGSQSQGSLGLSGGFVARGDGAGCVGDRLTVISLEIHVQVGSNRRPDPRRDSVHAVCWRVKDAFTSAEREVVEIKTGVIVLPLARTAGAPGGSVGGGSTRGVGRRSGVGTASSSSSTTTNSGSGPGGSSGPDLSRRSAAPERSSCCLKCGSHGSAPGTFCTFEGGGFLGQRLGGDPGGGAAPAAAAGAGEGRGTFRHGLGKGVEVVEVCSEAQLFRVLVGVFCRHDPDFVVGWEIQGDSLGYIIERGLNMDPSMDMTRLLSRTPGREADRRNGRDEWGKTHGSGIWLTGRTVLNMWRLMRSELKLCSYTLQSVAEHVLRKRIPSFSLHLRSRWFAGRDVAGRSKALSEPLRRAAASLTIMDKLDLVGRTGEMARLFGIDFFSVLSRGSQYRVEAVMLRVLKPQNYVAVSPSRQQVASQAAMESIPLVFEPQSRLYTNPVVVLDFQSLYPSMMIAYNLCYTTCLGKFDPRTGGTSGRLGVLSYSDEKTAAGLYKAFKSHDAWLKSRGHHHSHNNTSSDTEPPSAAGRPMNAPTPPRKASPEGGNGACPQRTSEVGCTHEGGRRTPEGSGGTPERGGDAPGREGGAGGTPKSSVRSPLPTVGCSEGGRERGGSTWDPRCIHVAPNTAGFCHPSLRQGVLPLMLREILETRVMIKGAMRRAEEAGQKVLARTLNARQFALKMISNVTYGYTAAGYSGRMPMAELADAIVESARQSLIAAARTVDNHGTWNASVVYGDTDSLFIELPGRSLEEAHRIGREMAAAVTRSCPPDVVLKFEKVYLPCILASKKRYVGHMFESPKDLKPSFDAKGIETVRRDGCPLLVKMLEKVLRILFTTKDLSEVKGYLYRQWTRILTDRAAVGDFIFAKEVRLGTYASDVYMPPSAIVASKAMATDPRAEPKYCERIPYVVVAGPVGARLMDLVVSPEQYLADGSGLRLNGKYYITKVINPAIDRALALVGVDVNAWYNDMPRPAPRVTPQTKTSMEGKLASAGAGRGGGGGGGREGWPGGRGIGKRASVITNFFISDRCSLCGDKCARSVCGNCAREPASRCVATARLRESDAASQQLLEICRQCAGHSPPELFGLESCGSLECPVFFERHRAKLKGREARELCDALGLLSSS